MKVEFHQRRDQKSYWNQDLSYNLFFLSFIRALGFSESTYFMILDDFF
jgi:hypothetical protein